MNHCLVCDTKILVQSSWRRFLFGEKPSLLCDKCSEELTYSELPFAIFTYNPMMQTIIKQYKFLKDIRFAAFFAQPLKKKLRTQKYDLIIPIPMHEKMETKRTFCHMTAIFEEMNLPFEQLLEKTTMEQQSKKTKVQREGVAPLFKMKQPRDLTGKTVLLVDDLLTTGTTLKHAENCLMAAGAKKVEKIVIVSGNN